MFVWVEQVEAMQTSVHSTTTTTTSSSSSTATLSTHEIITHGAITTPEKEISSPDMVVCISCLSIHEFHALSNPVQALQQGWIQCAGDCKLWFCNECVPNEITSSGLFCFQDDDDLPSQEYLDWYDQKRIALYGK